MSRHHRASKHSSKAPGVRRKLERMLPLRCVNCPHAVLPEHRWQVGHAGVEAADGGQTTVANCGPSHAWCPACKRACNQSAGGKRGAAITNARRATITRADREQRAW